MTDRLTNAFELLRQGGAVFAGRARLTNWSDNARGMNASFRLDASADPLDNPATHPFKGAHCSPKDGHEFMVLVIPVANGGEDTDTGSSNGRTADFDSANAASTPAPATTAEPRPVTNANRAGMMIREPLFWEWLRAQGFEARNADEANAVLLGAFGIESKRELDGDLDIAAEFDRWRRRYHAWTQEPAA